MWKHLHAVANVNVVRIMFLEPRDKSRHHFAQTVVVSATYTRLLWLQFGSADMDQSWADWM